MQATTSRTLPLLGLKTLWKWQIEDSLNHIPSCFCLFLSLSYNWASLAAPPWPLSRRMRINWNEFGKYSIGNVRFAAASLVVPLRLLLAMASPCFSLFPSLPSLPLPNPFLSLHVQSWGWSKPRSSSPSLSSVHSRVCLQLVSQRGGEGFRQSL